MNIDERDADKRGGLTHRSIGGLSWVVSSSAVDTVLTTVVLIVLARLLSPADFGLYTAALVVIKFVGLLSTQGVGPTLVQRPKLEERHIRASFGFAILSAILVMMLTWLSAPYVADFFQIPDLARILPVLALVLPIGSLSLVADALLQRELQFHLIARVQLVSGFIANGVVAIGLALAGFGVWSLVGSALALATLQAVLFSRARPFKKWPPFDHNSLRELLVTNWGFLFGQVANYFALQGDNLVVGRWLGAQALGLYARAYGLTNTPVQFFGSALDKVLFPSMASLQHDPQRIGSAYRRAVAVLALCMLPITALLFVLAPELIAVLLGPSWSSAVVPFQILTLGLFLRTCYKVGASVVRAMGAVYRFAWLQVLYGVLVVGGSIVGQNWGLPGVAVAVLGAIFVNYLLIARICLKLTHLSRMEFTKAHLSGLGLGIGVFVEIFVVAQILRELNSGAIVIVIVSLSAVGLSLLGLVSLVPRSLIGQDGVWLIRTLNKSVPSKFVFVKRVLNSISDLPANP